MTTANPDGPRLRAVTVDAEWITAHFLDGRRVSVPLWWSWRLEAATPAQRQHYDLLSDGTTVHCPDIDEDLSAEGFLTGTPAPRGRAYETFLTQRAR